MFDDARGPWREPINSARRTGVNVAVQIFGEERTLLLANTLSVL